MNALVSKFADAWLVDGARTPFVDYRGTLSLVSPIDLGIAAARAVIARAGADPKDIGTTIAGSMAQASFDAYVTPRHIGLYAGVPIERPAHLVQRICGTGLEVLSQAADAVSLGRVRLALAVGRENGSARLRVADNGPGIPAAALARLFEPFFSLKPNGTGLGLAIAKRTIDAHGGTITAESREGWGTCFDVVLPLERPPA